MKRFLAFFFLYTTLVASSQNSFYAEFGGAGQEMSEDVIGTTDGGWIVAGWTESFGDASAELLVKVDSVGNLEWAKMYDAAYDQKLFRITEKPNGNFIVAGTYIRHSPPSF